MVCPYCEQSLQEQRRRSLVVLGLLTLGVVVAVIWLRGAGKSSPLAEWIARHTPTPIAALGATPTPLPFAKVTPTVPPKASITPTRPPKLTPTITYTPTPLPLETTDEQGVPMVLVPAGPFTMGSEAEVLLAECEQVFPGLDCPNSMDWFKASEPVHTVTLDDYYIDKYEVTNGSYAQCEAAGACDPPHGMNIIPVKWRYGRQPGDFDYYGNPRYDDYPVNWTDWYQAQTYCQWRGTRLPTEAEWEKAARGTDDRLYPWGDTYDSYPGSIFFSDVSCDPITPWRCGPSMVERYPGDISTYGAHNMMSSDWEWVADWFDPNYYNYSPSENPLGPQSGEFHVLRGGMTLPSWLQCCVTTRAPGGDPKFDLPRWGRLINFSAFRCARGVSPKEDFPK